MVGAEEVSGCVAVEEDAPPVEVETYCAESLMAFIKLGVSSFSLVADTTKAELMSGHSPITIVLVP